MRFAWAIPKLAERERLRRSRHPGRLPVRPSPPVLDSNDVAVPVVVPEGEREDAVVEFEELLDVEFESPSRLRAGGIDIRED
jgi:hypothetical protein